MAGRVGWRALAVATALLALSAVVGVVGADHSGCPPFERLRYDYFVEFNHGGDLFSRVHVVGFTDFRFCYELRDRVIEEKIRFEARGGEYVLRVVGDGFDDRHVLRAGANATGWYEHAAVDLIQIAGLSAAFEPTVVAGETPPAAQPTLLRAG